MEIALIIIGSLTLVSLLILIILLLTKSNKSNNVDLKEMGMISQQINSLPSSLSKDMKISIQEEINKISEKELKNNEIQNEKLERFQSNITKSINDRFDSMNQGLETKILELNKKVDEKLKEGFSNTSQTMIDVRERLKAIDVAQQNIQSLSKDVVSLKNVLDGNQSRGKYGEYQLSMVLHNVFGDTEGCYKEQYTLKKTKDGNDVRADAVVFMPEPNKMICIDSKFPFSEYEKIFENDNEEERIALTKKFASDVKKHITVIKDKYIVDGKTAQEAIIFIPNDGVFAFVHHNCNDVVEYAREQKVILTSPSTLPPILVTINMVKIDAERAKNVKEISKQLGVLGKQFELFSEEWEALSRQLNTASKTREKLDSRVNRISTKFGAISDSSITPEIEEAEVVEDI